MYDRNRLLAPLKNLSDCTDGVLIITFLLISPQRLLLLDLR